MLTACIGLYFVLPWAPQGAHPAGDVLEIGAGGGAMAAELLATHPDIRMTVTDFDPEMVSAADERLARFADRITTQPADATSLPSTETASTSCSTGSCCTTPRVGEGARRSGSRHQTGQTGRRLRPAEHAAAASAASG
jgi:SAM-dependent methyltransferase